MGSHSEDLREFFNHNVTDGAADYIDELEKNIATAYDKLRRCKTVMECNDPTNYKLIFGDNMRCSEADCTGDTPIGCQCYKRVEEIGDHMALSCNCGSVKFNLLRTEKIECAGCGKVLRDTFWHCNNSRPLQGEAGQA